MKIMKKIVAVVALVSMLASLAITVSAASFNTVTLTPSVASAKAGDTIMVDTCWDTLVGAKGLQIKVTYDNTAFAAVSGDNTDYNFGMPPFSNSYLPAYMDAEFISSRYAWLKQQQVDEKFNVTSLFPAFTPNDTGSYVAYLFADTSGNTVISADYDSYIKSSKLGTNFKVLDTAEPGTYTFSVEMIISDSTVGDIPRTATAQVTIAADEPEVEYETKTEERAVTVNTNNITVDGKEYSNVATFSDSFTLPTLKAGESLTAVGVMYDDNSVKTFPTLLSGGGNFEYKVLFYGINPTDAAELGTKIKTYYTGSFIKAN